MNILVASASSIPIRETLLVLPSAGTMIENTTGTATVVGTRAPSLRADGPCLTGTLRALGSGARPMPGAALEKIKHDALDLLGLIVSDYEAHIATGEVGAGGSAKAGRSTPNHPSTGLLYGRIQSGKTVAMIGLVAAAVDNGFRVIIVLTSDNVKLVSQTTERFGALEGPIAIDALKPGDWSTDHRHIGKHIPQSGVVFVCSKNTKRLDDLIKFLEQVNAPGYPALILDDEADQATLDANLARNSRAKEKGKPVVDPTAIYRRVVDLLRVSLRHHVFLQVTATPYALLLQSVGTQLRPNFTRLLEPGAGYTGGESFFEAEHINGPQPPLVFVPEKESDAIQSGAPDAPEGLQKAIAFFLIAAGAQAISDPASARAGQNFLCHTSQLRTQHKTLESLVRRYIDRIGDNLDADAGAALNRLHLAFDELCRTTADPPPLEAIIGQVKRLLVNRKVVVINSEADAEPGRGLNFIVGGNILGRGVTIENLLVTYYLREPKMGQMDTMLQHARMYGYRAKLMHLTRVFLPRQLAVRFYEIHKIEERLRRQLKRADMGKPILIDRVPKLNPTRRSILDPGYIDGFDAGDQIFPIYPDFRMKDSRYQAIQTKVQHLVGGALSLTPQLVSIGYEDLLWLIDNFPYDKTKTSSSWIPQALRRVVEGQRERCGGRAFIYTRNMNRKIEVFASGALSSTEVETLGGQGKPVFCAFWDSGALIPAEVGASKYWYPMLVLDSSMPSLILNNTFDG